MLALWASRLSAIVHQFTEHSLSATDMDHMSLVRSRASATRGAQCRGGLVFAWFHPRTEKCWRNSICRSFWPFDHLLCHGPSFFCQNVWKGPKTGPNRRPFLQFLSSFGRAQFSSRWISDGLGPGGLDEWVVVGSDREVSYFLAAFSGSFSSYRKLSRMNRTFQKNWYQVCDREKHIFSFSSSIWPRESPGSTEWFLLLS